MNETQIETQGEIIRLKKELLLAQTQLRALVEQSSSAPDATERKRTGESLRASEANMAAAQRIAHFGSWELELSNPADADANALRWSDEMFRIAGYEPGAVEVSNELFFHLVHPDDREAIRQAMTRVLRERQPYSIVHRLIRPDGDERVVQEMAQIFCDEETGQPLKIVGTAHDITERKRAEEELHWKTAFLEAQANSSIDGILVVDQQDRMILQNPRFIDLLKIPAHIVDEKDDENRLRWVTDMTRNPEQFVKKVLYLYAHRDETSRDEIELKDGTILDRYSAPVVGHDGKYYGRIWTFRDITEGKLAETALRESDEKFRHLADNITDAFWIRSPDMREVHYISPAFERIWGRSVESLYANPAQWPELILPADRDRVLGAFARFQDDSPNLEIEYRIVRPGGEIRWVFLRASQVRDAAGKLIRLTGIVTDITDRKTAEETLRESEERFSGAFEHAPIGVALVSAEGRWLKVNRALCGLVGYTEAELLTQNFQDITHPGDLEADLENVRRMLAGEIRFYQMEKRYVHASGHLVNVLLDVSLVSDREGRPRYFISQIQDITQRKQAEAELSIERTMLRELLDLLPDVIYVKDHQSRFLAANAACARVMGAASSAQLIGKTDAAFYPPERAAVYRADEFKVLEGIVIVDQEDMVVSPSGIHQYFLTTKIPLRDASGNIVGLVGSGRDITERKRSEAALKTAHQELVEASHQAGMAEVATSVLHNVGNVLNSVNVASTCLADSLRKSKAANLSKVVTLLSEHENDLGAFLSSDPKGRQIPGYLSQLACHLAGEQASALKELAELQKNIEHIKDIVSMQQSFAKVSGVTETLKVTELVEDALRMNSSSLCRHDIQVIREFEASPNITTEKHKIVQILVNLVRNAKQSCDESGEASKRLIVRVTNGNGHVRISVNDNGVGISPENLTRIFSHGFTTKKNGHGFGLHSGALAAKDLGGSLSVQSGGLGQGATFTVELPVERMGGSHG